MLIPRSGCLLIQPDRPDTGGDTILVGEVALLDEAIVLEDGLAIPASVRQREVVTTGVIVATSPKDDWHRFHGRRVLYNPWQAVEIHEELVMCQSRSLIAFRGEADLTWHPREAWVHLAPMAEAPEATAGGILLTDTYRAALNGGLIPETLAIAQVNLCQILASGHQAVRMGIGPPDWVLASYDHVLWWKNRGGRETLFVDAGRDSQPILAVVPQAIVDDTLATYLA
jgi:hypothetical protein